MLSEVLTKIIGYTPESMKNGSMCPPRLAATRAKRARKAPYGVPVRHASSYFCLDLLS
jgi:hypothetical protein